MADISKLTHATGDQWCSIICQCMSALLWNKGTVHLFIAFEVQATSVTCLVDKEMAILHQGAVVILQLSLVPGIPGHPLPNVLMRAMESLQRLEPVIYLHQVLCRPVESDNKVPLPRPPHRSQGLHDVPPMLDSLRTWGEIMEMLW
ncbi:hypothetical protein JVT61DRAFT_6259 [Boletus reticuloceps]|uniref:Uncharacterized protein n=1 Tax=Boletus reticuloceps TaxID=495285 RepID=A0A8I2YKZ3_9AGAM|nr:hypothetical protein JVT61DRAFT_6259 [Boletus reticuloceps]